MGLTSEALDIQASLLAGNTDSTALETWITTGDNLGYWLQMMDLASERKVLFNNGDALDAIYNSATAYANTRKSDLRKYLFPMQHLLNLNLFLRCNGFDGSTYIKDSGNNDLSPTLTGHTSLSDNDYVFSPTSIYFDGTGDYMDYASSANFGFGTGDFFIGYWLKFTALPAQIVPFDMRSGGVTQVRIAHIISASGTLNLYVNGSNVITSAALSTNTWYYISCERVSGVTNLRVNGVPVGTPYTDANSYLDSPVRLGAQFNNASPITGYIDQPIIIKGDHFWDGDFIPQTFGL